MPSEFQLIEQFLSPFARRGQGLVLGPGDDCAVVRASPGTETCVTTDAVVEEVHFTFRRFSAEDVGHKALAVNLSDLAAMGAVPRWFVCSVTCRKEQLPLVKGIATGMARLAERSRILLVGGNFSRGEALQIHITAAGEVPRGRAITRGGAKPGDRIYVTGTLGDAALALALRDLDRRTSAAFLRQARPEPRLGAGVLARKYATAAIDLSDGLLQDLSHVADASGVACRVDARAVPVSSTFVDLNANLDLALTGGEDYELALFVPEKRSGAFERAMKQAGERVTAVGEVVRGHGLEIRNAPHLKSWGHDHFASRPASRRRARN